MATALELNIAQSFGLYIPIRRFKLDNSPFLNEKYTNNKVNSPKQYIF